MRKSCTVYMATHMPTNKSYIGVTTNLKNRRGQHNCNPSSPIAQLIKKDGTDRFQWTVIAEKLHPKEAARLERDSIDKYETLRPNGLNRGQRDALSSLLKARNPNYRNRMRERVLKAVRLNPNATNREIASSAGINAISLVAYYLKSLLASGEIAPTMKITPACKTQELILTELRKNPNLTAHALGKAIGMKSTSVLWYNLHALIAAGKVARGPKMDCEECVA